MEFNQVIYIDGVKHNCTGIGGRFYADSDKSPNTPCSQHSLSRVAVFVLKEGGRVKTSGHVYSLLPDPESKKD